MWNETIGGVILACGLLWLAKPRLERFADHANTRRQLRRYRRDRRARISRLYREAGGR